jgi:hypothetical protein
MFTVYYQYQAFSGNYKSILISCSYYYCKHVLIIIKNYVKMYMTESNERLVI